MHVCCSCLPKGARIGSHVHFCLVPSMEVEKRVCKDRAWNSCYFSSSNAGRGESLRNSCFFPNSPSPVVKGGVEFANANFPNLCLSPPTRTFQDKMSYSSEFVEQHSLAI